MRATAPTITRRIGLRGKALLALFLACLFVIVPSLLIGWSVVQNVREHFGIAFARNYTQLHSQRIFAPVSRDLALSLRLADSVLLRRWLQHEGDTESRALFFREADGFMRDFRDHSFFVISDASRHYYFKDGGTADAEKPRYTLNPREQNDAWYFSTMRNEASFNINVSRDVNLNVTKVWINVPVTERGKKIGLTGSGIDLTGFLNDFAVSKDEGVTPMVADRQGLLLAHPDAGLISYDTVGRKGGNRHDLASLLDDDASRTSLRDAMQQAEQSPGEVQIAWVQMGGKRQLASLTYIPELQWHVVSVIDLGAAHILELGWFTPLAVLLAVLLIGLLLSFGYAVERLILSPIRKLNLSARAITSGHYEVALPEATNDEIGELSGTFGIMANKVRCHMEKLENRVRERTLELESAHTRVTDAYRLINQSLGYAVHLQRAILPDLQLRECFGQNHFVMWKPRDVVGGDFYAFHAKGDGVLLGLFDCAGHGVPGAMMTMLMSSAMDNAVVSIGLSDPAALLARADSVSRMKMTESLDSAAIASDTDAALVYAEPAAGLLRFAGAKISLFVWNGTDVEEIKGARRPLGGKRIGQYANVELRIDPANTYYLVTDGFLDQAGGAHGFGFGRTRFMDMLRRNAGLPVAGQQEAFAGELAAFQGNRPQRDDITLLSFRFL